MTLRRTGFGRYLIVRKPPTAMTMAMRAGLGLQVSKPRAAVLAQVDAAAATPQIAKSDVCRHEGYRRLVAALPCKNCGIWGYSQAAHPNTGKGAGMKTDDRLCFALCADRPGVRGCHSAFDQGAQFSKEGRRLIEQAWGADTRRQITTAGEWPADLPRLVDAESPL